MLPTLASGDHLLVDPVAFRHTLPKPGDLVVASHPYVRDQILVKRVARVLDTGVWLASDNPDEGTDSRTLGIIPMDRLLGRVTTRI